MYRENYLGFDLLVKRHPFGHYLGYVFLPKGHQFHGVDCENIDVDVNGGLTYSELDTYTGDWKIGFDTGHPGDEKKGWTLETVLIELACVVQQFLHNKVKLRSVNSD